MLVCQFLNFERTARGLLAADESTYNFLCGAAYVAFFGGLLALTVYLPIRELQKEAKTKAS